MKLNWLFRLAFIALFTAPLANARTVIAIDAGHGGKDPGAIGRSLGVKEKDVTLSIARELKALLDADPNFRAVMTRNGDYFIQLPQRTEIARKNRANYLVSIHADSSPSSENLRGASVWVLSNRRANDELGKWLEDHEKQSELLGGAGSVLAQANERYLSQTVLDLQFSHAQRAGYELGKTVLNKMSGITRLAKSAPQHASLSVLRSPDIPSILVETGFLSNATEEQQLSSLAYRRQVAKAIYHGLVDYQRRYYKVSPKAMPAEKSEKATQAVEKSVKKETEQKDADKKASEKKRSEKHSSEKHSNEKQSNEKNSSEKNSNEKKINEKKGTDKPAADKTESKTEGKSEGKTPAKKESKTSAKAEKTVDLNAKFHVVQQDETLYSIARLYKTTPEKLSELNDIKQNKIVVGKRLRLK